ncbi:MAG TPA: 3-hydroxyanthranilate 3,4-dioxygenase [Thermoanaerobaculia bacterium]|nr:3-hydroxyanthranilate 3,4-dioxygenase [Thermoanaerobaculia bacterium]
MESKALNFQRWIDEHRGLLKPPVGNKKVFEDDEFIVMVVGGPNSRKDYHIDEGPEFFYQLEGEMVLKTIQGGKVVDVPIRAGEIFLLPGRVPHSPQRMPNSVGLVIERRRLPHEKDGLQWYCDQCTSLLYEEFFTLHNVEKDFPPIFDRFFANEKKRTCKKCGAVMPKPPAPGA